MEIALKRYYELFEHEVKGNPKKYYELKTEWKGIGHYNYYTDLNLPKKEIESYKNGEYMERFIYLRKITEKEYVENIA